MLYLPGAERRHYIQKYVLFILLSTNLHAACEHDADGHEFGEDPQELGVRQHAVFQAVVQEAGVMAEHVIDV